MYCLCCLIVANTACDKGRPSIIEIKREPERERESSSSSSSSTKITWKEVWTFWWWWQRSVQMIADAISSGKILLPYDTHNIVHRTLLLMCNFGNTAKPFVAKQKWNGNTCMNVTPCAHWQTARGWQSIWRTTTVCRIWLVGWMVGFFALRLRAK